MNPGQVFDDAALAGVVSFVPAFVGIVVTVVVPTICLMWARTWAVSELD